MDETSELYLREKGTVVEYSAEGTNKKSFSLPTCDSPAAAPHGPCRSSALIGVPMPCTRCAPALLDLPQPLMRIAKYTCTSPLWQELASQTTVAKRQRGKAESVKI
jgi:hypothetical protein